MNTTPRNDPSTTTPSVSTSVLVLLVGLGLLPLAQAILPPSCVAFLAGTGRPMTGIGKSRTTHV